MKQTIKQYYHNKKGGRCRFDVKESSFTFRRGNVLSVERLDED